MLGLDNVRDHSALGLSDVQLIEMYRTMLLARKLDERVWALNRQGRVPFVVSVAGHAGGRHRGGAVDLLRQRQGLGHRIVVIGQPTPNRDDLDVVDSGSVQHQLGRLGAGHAAEQPDLRVLVEGRLGLEARPD